MSHVPLFIHDRMRQSEQCDVKSDEKSRLIEDETGENKENITG